MNETIHQTLTDTLDYLMALVQDDTRPEEAKSGLRPLQTKHSNVGMRLIWEEETYDHSIHYDALLNLPGSGTVSLSYCDDRAMPWPLRGVHRWSDADVVRVNNEVLTVDQAIACLDFIWDEARITDQLVNTCIIQEELEKRAIDLSDKELQAGMDGFRRVRKLYKAEDTYRWMERRGVTHAELEQLVAGQVKVLKLRDSLVASRVQACFDARNADFDCAYIAQILFSDEPSALEVSEQIRHGEMNFFDEAQRRFLAAKHAQESTMDLFTIVRRRDAPAEIRTSLFESAPGSLIGPTREDNGYVIRRVLSLSLATFDEPTRNAIKNILFEEWLEERRRAASIEWLWGNAIKTTQLARTDAAVNLSFAG